MKKTVFFILLIAISTPLVYSQSKLNINYACSYYGEKTPTSVYTFSSDNEALSALKLIADASGLSTNFTLVAADVPNAAAVIFNNNRYILYNQTFMNNISQRINYWASISILAHEVGHHLNGHSLIPGGSRPGLELEADKFSGFILGRLGANLEQAQSAINTLASISGSLTHPPKSSRLAAIANGWYNGKDITSIESRKKVTPLPDKSVPKVDLGSKVDDGIIFYIDERKQHGKIFKIIEQKVDYYSFISLERSLTNWRLPTLEDYDQMYQNLQRTGKYEFILVIEPNEKGVLTRNCNTADYWIPYSLDYGDGECGGSARTFNFCKINDTPMPCCAKGNYYPIILVKNF